MATPPPSSPTGRPRLLSGRATRTNRPPHQRRRRTRRILASEGVFDSIVSLAGLLGRPVRNQTGRRRSAGSTMSSPAGQTARSTRR